jgi:hypothetical protein
MDVEVLAAQTGHPLLRAQGDHADLRWMRRRCVRVVLVTGSGKAPHAPLRCPR